MGMTIDELENAMHCLKVMVDEEVCEECKLYGTTGTDHCEADCVRVAIDTMRKYKKIEQIIEVWHQDIFAKDFECIAEVAEVVEDGNDKV